jgi:hypothetical protein
MDSNRIPGLTHPFEEFVTGAAGAETYNCAAGRSDWCQASQGFAVIDVTGASYTVNFYTQGNSTPVKTLNFQKTAPSPSMSAALSQAPNPSTVPPTNPAYPTPTLYCLGSCPTLPITPTTGNPTQYPSISQPPISDYPSPTTSISPTIKITSEPKQKKEEKKGKNIFENIWEMIRKIIEFIQRLLQQLLGRFKFWH